MPSSIAPVLPPGARGNPTAVATAHRHRGARPAPPPPAAFDTLFNFTGAALVNALSQLVRRGRDRDAAGRLARDGPVPRRDAQPVPARPRRDWAAARRWRSRRERQPLPADAAAPTPRRCKAPPRAGELRAALERVGLGVRRHLEHRRRRRGRQPGHPHQRLRLRRRRRSSAHAQHHRRLRAGRRRHLRGACRARSAPARATCSRPASMARTGSARPMSRPPRPTPGTTPRPRAP